MLNNDVNESTRRCVEQPLSKRRAAMHRVTSCPSKRQRVPIFRALLGVAARSADRSRRSARERSRAFANAREIPRKQRDARATQASAS